MSNSIYIEVFTRGNPAIPIWIGKNARANDRLTFQLAHPRDLWFHIQGAPGAHVILPTAADLQDACYYARLHSKATGACSKPPVTCAEISQLSKSKYDKPGQVKIFRAETVYV
jgi:predicted ribosome quality control (RQC) complex YloA/Tae2 family protein